MESGHGWRAWRAATASLLCPPSAAGSSGVMWRITDSSASFLLNPGFNQCLVHPAMSQPWKCHSEQDWDRQSLHRECGMFPDMWLFHDDFAIQDMLASGAADPGGIVSRVLRDTGGAALPEQAGPPQTPQFYHLSLAKPSSGQAPGLAFPACCRHPLAGLGILGASWEPTTIAMC